MTRILLAFAWLRWRLMGGSFRSRGGRDLIARASRIGEIVGPWALALMILPAALGLSFLGALGGWFAARAAEHRDGMLLVARLVLGAATVMVFVGQLVRAMVGARSDPARFQLLPIPRRLLHASTVVSGLADPWLCIALPGVFCFVAGLAAAGAFAAAATGLVASLLVVAILLLIGSCLECTLQMLFRNRRRGEWVTLVATAMLALTGFLPMALDDRISGAKAAPSATHVPRAVAFAPSELWGTAVSSALTGRAGTALAALGGLLVIGAGLYVASAFLYERLVGSPSVGGGRGRRGDRPRELPRLPGLTTTASSVAWTQLRSTLRTVSGKSMVLVGPLAFGLLVLVGPRMVGGESPAVFTADPQMLVAFGALFFSLAGLPRISANQFALDGPGVTLQFLAPITDRDLVRGKMAGIGMLWFLSITTYLLVGLPQVPRGTPWTVPAALMSGVAAYLLFAPTAAILAAIFPKAADLSKLGSGAKPHPIAAFVATMMALVLPAVPVLLSLGNYPRGTTAAGFGWAALCAALAAGASIPLQRLAAEVLARRREAIVFAARDR